ncbi:MAG: lipopolysaccharide biosynthesis protein [Planctomycetota bacterium]|jgi:O-antigen/teichoic acid export membrane protein
MRTETRDSIILLVGTGLTAVLSLVFSVYAQNALGPVLAGDFVTALAIIAWCQIGFGPINGTVAHFTARFASRDDRGQMVALVRHTKNRVVRLQFLPLLALIVFVRPMAGFFRMDHWLPLLLALLVVALTLYLSVVRGALRGSQKYLALGINGVFEASLRLMIGLLFIGMACGTASALTAYLVAVGAAIVLGDLQFRRVSGNAEPAAATSGSMAHFAIPMFVAMMISAGFQNADMFAAKHYLTDKEAGMFGAAFVMGRVFSALVTPFTTMLLPLLSAMHETGQAMLGAFVRVVGYFLAIAAIPLALLAIWPGEVIGLVYSDAFSGADKVVFRIALSRCLGYLCHMIALAGASRGDFRFLALYLPSLAGQVILLGWRHDSAEEIANMLLIGHVVALTAMVIAALRLFRPRSA